MTELNVHPNVAGSHLSPHTSYLTPHTSYLTPHTSALIPHTSYLSPHTPYIPISYKNTLQPLLVAGSQFAGSATMLAGSATMAAVCATAQAADVTTHSGRPSGNAVGYACWPERPASHTLYMTWGAVTSAVRALSTAWRTVSGHCHYGQSDSPSELTSTKAE